MNRHVYLIGNTNDQRVSGLIASLKKAGFTAQTPDSQSAFQVALICFTGQELTSEEWRIIDRNREARFIIPVDLREAC